VDEEENKYDSYDLKKWKLKNNKYGYKGRPMGITKTHSGISSSAKRPSTKVDSKLDTGQPLKKKTTMSVVNKTDDDNKKRKTTNMIGGRDDIDLKNKKSMNANGNTAIKK
jgi:hypothetical protein